ncbi:zinc finger domain-containing protein [Mycolicibacterium mageritense]|uniref:zinc finger domain-containing protein n=1 Tax=Mycolicibacterium mageritense TaxID=53462 RepID=UPI001E622C75|nr:hypothetical protein [Mycolicibacterium mageritense]GJJ24126.1 hypothetical protein MTY414_78000 [Mycolicibacterium mageritense]
MTSTKRPNGHRLSNRTDPAVIDALTRVCPDCKAGPSEWCVGISGTTMRGRRLTRIHFARCRYQEETTTS